MDNGRQRAHSASSLKAVQIYGPSSKWTKHQARSTPELRMYMQQSMLSGLNTTVPQSLVPQHLGRAHKPRPKHGTTNCCAKFCTSCCSVRLFLVFSQLVIGAAITAISFYLFFYTTNSLRIRDTPFWAGIPLFLAGCFGIYVCANDYENYIGNSKHFVIKGCCFILTAVCIFVCLIASTFPVIHVVKLHEFQYCKLTDDDCFCYEADDMSNPHAYRGLGNCDLLFCLVKICFLVESGLCVLGSGFSFWFAIILWNSKYGGIYSGIRYSLSSSNNENLV